MKDFILAAIMAFLTGVNLNLSTLNCGSIGITFVILTIFCFQTTSSMMLTIIANEKYKKKHIVMPCVLLSATILMVLPIIY